MSNEDKIKLRMSLRYLMGEALDIRQVVARMGLPMNASHEVVRRACLDFLVDTIAMRVELVNQDGSPHLHEGNP